MQSTLGFAAGRYFSNITFGGESRKKGTKVITGTPFYSIPTLALSDAFQLDIVDSFKTSLKSIAWMDHKSAKAAAEKADALAVKVGYPLSPDTTDAHSIWAYYYLVTIDENDFFGNVLGAE
jgi:endothelin-converting enzyme